MQWGEVAQGRSMTKIAAQGQYEWSDGRRSEQSRAASLVAMAVKIAVSPVPV